MTDAMGTLFGMDASGAGGIRAAAKHAGDQYAVGIREYLKNLAAAQSENGKAVAFVRFAAEIAGRKNLRRTLGGVFDGAEKRISGGGRVDFGDGVHFVEFLARKNWSPRSCLMKRKLKRC